MATYDKEEKRIILSSEDKQALSPNNKRDVANRTIYQIINGTIDGYNQNKDYIQ